MTLGVFEELLCEKDLENSSANVQYNCNHVVVKSFEFNLILILILFKLI